MNSTPAEEKEDKNGRNDYKQFVVSEEIVPKVGEIWLSKNGYIWHTDVEDTVKIIEVEVDVDKIQFAKYNRSLSYRDNFRGDQLYPTSIWDRNQKQTMKLSKFTEDYFPYVKDSYVQIKNDDDENKCRWVPRTKH